jgi:hypothetical protein
MSELKLQRVNVEKKGRHYRLPSGKLVPSVTNKLGILDKPALKFWAAQIERDLVVRSEVTEFLQGTTSPPRAAEDFESKLRARLGAKYAHQMRLKEAGDIGSSLHTMIQDELKARMKHYPGRVTHGDHADAALLAFMAWEDWAEKVNLEPTHVETMLGSELMDVGGTLDCAGTVNCPHPGYQSERIEVVFDWKSSKRSKTSPNGIYPESEIQVSVYREIAIEMGLMGNESWAAVVRLPKTIDDPCLTENEPFDVKWIEPERATRLASGFLSIGDAWNFMKGEFGK